MPNADHRLFRFSLAGVWLFTAVVSVWELTGQSRLLLVSAGIQSIPLANALVWSGAALDLALGLALLLTPRLIVFRLALLAMVGMTLVASVLQPSLWLHPLGPLSKNIPMAAMLWVLCRGPK
jgi:hypothetical protein